MLCPYSNAVNSDLDVKPGARCSLWYSTYEIPLRSRMYSLVFLFALVVPIFLLVLQTTRVVLAQSWGDFLDPATMASQPELALGNREKIAQDALRMCRDHLAHGVGLGAFEVAYTPYQSIVTDLTIDYAHDDYVQFMAETGIWGWILAPLAITIFFMLSFRHLRKRLRQQSGWLQFGAAVGVCGLLVHSVSEFNLHIPANAAWFSFLAALATLPRTRSGRV